MLPSLVDCVSGVKYPPAAGGGGARRPDGVYADIMQLLDAEREARQRKKRLRSAQQVQAEWRVCARCG